MYGIWYIHNPKNQAFNMQLLDTNQLQLQLFMPHIFDDTNIKF
jgi:hypothetical protein